MYHDHFQTIKKHNKNPLKNSTFQLKSNHFEMFKKLFFKLLCYQGSYRTLAGGLTSTSSCIFFSNFKFSECCNGWILTTLEHIGLIEPAAVIASEKNNHMNFNISFTI